MPRAKGNLQIFEKVITAIMFEKDERIAYLLPVGSYKFSDWELKQVPDQVFLRLNYNGRHVYINKNYLDKLDQSSFKITYN